MKPDSYYAHARPEMLAYFPASPGRVLDVGCGNGRFGAMLKDRLDCAEVWGVEPMPEAYRAAVNVLDHALSGNFDESLGLADASFDTIVFNDSLEHFPEARAPLSLARRLLRPGGRIVASIPNVRHWPHLRRYVFLGEWKYEESGILDRTHLRFFTYSSILETFRGAGFSVQQIEGITPCWRGSRLALAKALLPRGMQDVLYMQFAVVATVQAHINIHSDLVCDPASIQAKPDTAISLREAAQGLSLPTTDRIGATGTGMSQCCAR